MLPPVAGLLVFFATFDLAGERAVVKVALGIDRCAVEHLTELENGGEESERSERRRVAYFHVGQT